VTEIVLLKKGGGFVKFDSMESADACFQAHSASTIQHPGTTRPMKVVFATPGDASKKNGGHNGPTTSSIFGAGSQMVQLQRQNPLQQQQQQQQQQLQQMQPQMMVQQQSPAGGMTSDRPVQKGPVGANIFVANHPYSWTKSEVEGLFAPYGPLVSVSVPFDRATQQAKGYSVVSFQSPQSAEAAIQDLNGSNFNGRRIEVSLKKGDGANSGPFTQVRSTSSPNGQFAQQAQQMVFAQQQQMQVQAQVQAMQPKLQPRQNTMTIGNTRAMQVPGAKVFAKVGSKMTDADFKKLFSLYGTVIEATLQKDSAGNPKNVGFVNYDSVVSAVQAVKALNGQMLSGATAPLDVSIKKGEEQHAEPYMNMPMSKGPDGANLFVCRLPDLWTEDDLVKAFSQFGEIWSVKINVDPKTGSKKGFGFVSFSNPTSAAAAIAQLDGATVEGKQLGVSLKTAGKAQ